MQASAPTSPRAAAPVPPSPPAGGPRADDDGQTAATLPDELVVAGAGLPRDNPLARPLAAGLLGSQGLARLANEPRGMARALAGTMVAAELVAHAPNIEDLSGAGVAVAASALPIYEADVQILGPHRDPKLSDLWWVQSHRRIGATGALAVGAGFAAVGAGVLVDVTVETEVTLCTALPRARARALLPAHERGLAGHLWHELLQTRQRLSCPPVRRIEDIDVLTCRADCSTRSASLGIVFSGMLQGGAGYVNLGGTFERVVWRPDANTLQIADAVERIRECGLVAGLSYLEKAELSRSDTHASRVVVAFDLSSPSGAEAAGRALADRILPLSRAPLADGPPVVRFGAGLPEGVRLLAVERVEQRTYHLGAGLLDALARCVRLSGLGFSWDAMREQRLCDEGLRARVMHTRARRVQVGMLWAGQRSEVLYVNAQYAYPHGQPPAEFDELKMGVQMELTHVHGHNRRRLIDRINRAFALELEHFPHVASHAGYFVNITRRVSQKELAELARITEADLAARLPHLNHQHAPLIKIIAALNEAARRAGDPRGAAVSRPVALSPMQLLRRATVAAEGAPPPATPAEDFAIAQSRVLVDEVSRLETLGALSQLLGDDGLQVEVRNGACQLPLEEMAPFQLAYGGPGQRLAAGDPPDEVVRRLRQASSLRELIKDGLEALAADVIGNVLDSQHMLRTGEELHDAAAEVEEATTWAHLSERERLCLWRRDEIYEALEPWEQAEALALFTRTGVRRVRAHERAAVAEALAERLAALSAWRPPTAQLALAAHLRARLDRAASALHTVPMVGTESAWRPAPRPQIAADDRARQAMLPADASLRALALFDLFILVQDDVGMGDVERRAAASALRHAVALAAPRVHGGVEVAFVGDVLADLPSSRLTHAREVEALPWEAVGGQTLVGNAVETVLCRLADDLRAGQPRRPLALLVLATGGMSDAHVLKTAAARLAGAFGDDFQDEACIGLLQLAGAAATPSATNTLARLDDGDDGGTRIEADTDLTQNMGARVERCLRGMLDARWDEANDLHNRANAVREGFHRLLHFFDAPAGGAGDGRQQASTSPS